METETVLPDITLAAGTFLLTDAKIVYRLIPTGTGDGIPPGTPTVLLNGPDVGLDKNLTAIDLVEDWLVVGGTVLPAGTLLISMDGEDLVGSNSLSTTRRDVFALTLSATTAGSGTGAGSAEPFFVGPDVSLDTNNESVAGFSIVGGTPATAPVAYDDSLGATKDWPAIARVLDNDVDPNGDPMSIDSFTQGSNGAVTDNGDDTLTYTPDPGWTGVDTFSYTI
ncbi:MAG: Ig-like domain-containing protein, partial [Acidimicrobiia bacterium]|nr:Ig-like domain-containing protein [Acidimicrobiia bacterium]